MNAAHRITPESKTIINGEDSNKNRGKVEGMEGSFKRGEIIIVVVTLLYKQLYLSLHDWKMDDPSMSR